MGIQIGKYKRPGIFLEEYDDSGISSPTVSGISTMVIGFSKKGPVNTPILLTNTGDADKIIGTLDRNLERKGSFLHRTVSKMLESSPVYAINLLLTDDNLDKVDYKSLSTSAIYKNDTIRSGAYRKFFDTTGFWKRDTDSFINLVNLDASQVGDADRLLNITNLGDKYATVFIFKSKVSGYDRTLLEWYGSIDKLPAYLSENDWASDYMVDVLIVGGEWSDYQTLSDDSRWSKYFNTSGLMKDQIYNFANNSLVNLLGFYEGLSLIPYFRNSNNTNVFIETVLNRDTDKTGIFCAFNSDLFETDVQNNKIDLIGNSLVGSNATSLDFLSYKDIIVENLEYKNIELDRPGNVFGLYPSTTLASEPVDTGSRTSYYGEGLIYDVTTNFDTIRSGVNLEYENLGGTAFAIINGVKVQVIEKTFSFMNGLVNFPESDGVEVTYKYAFALTPMGTIVQIGGPGLAQFPQVDASYTVLHSLTFKALDGVISDAILKSEALKLDGTYDTIDGYSVTNVGTLSNAELKIEFDFPGTTGAITTRDYEKYRKLKHFNYLLSLLNSPTSKKGAILIKTTDKTSLSDMSVKDINITSLTKKSFVLVTNLRTVDVPLLLEKKICVYKYDDEQIFGTSKIVNEEVIALDTNGIFSKWSPLYLAFEQGLINSGDYFMFEGEKVYLQMFTDTADVAVIKYVTIEGANVTLTDSISSMTISSNKSNYTQTVEIEKDVNYTPKPNRILISASRYTEIKVGDFLESDWETNWLTSPDYDPNREPRRMVRILSKKLYPNNNNLVEIITDGDIKKTPILTTETLLDFFGQPYTSQTRRFTQLENYVNAYNGITLRGFRVRNESMPDGTEERQNAILNLVAKGTPIFKAITNKEAIDFRYLVDGFGLGLTELSKHQLVDICGKRLDVFGIINMPSLKSFKKSTSPSFVDEDGVLQVKYISMGSNPESSPAFNYSFADGTGVSSVGYFLPYLKVNDNGRSIDVPPAMFVASTYMRKSNSNVSTVTPYTIAAGVVDGKINGIAGVEEEFTPEDIEFLNEARMNPIVYKRNRGFSIETENTALTQYKSSLSYIHSREVLIELERELGAMLLDFQWKYNTPEVRAEIKLRADIICGKYVSKKGLYNFFNKCDDENNTDEIIGNQIGVLDTYVEVTMGMGVIVNNVTILRTGAIQSGGFRLQ